MRPKPETVAAVTAWLAENDITASTISPAGDWLAFSIPVSKANALFDAQFTTFSHLATGESAIRTMAYSIPADLRNDIDLVHPTITCVFTFAVARAPGSRPGAGSRTRSA